MTKPAMLWFDCTSREEAPDMRRRAMERFDVVCSVRVDQAADEIARTRPKALCFDFDYPDRERLRTMQAIKRANASLPVLILTIEHSEALAVWSFRVPVWNYLVKPVAAVEWQQNLLALAKILPTERRSGRSIYLNEPTVPRGVPMGRADDPQLALLPALSYIEQHFSTRVSASQVARACAMTRFQFSRLFHAAFGMTFKEYLLRFRVAEACRLLEQNTASVTEVGCAAGFNDSSYFARLFRRYTGMLPSQYVSAQTRPSAASVHPSAFLARPRVAPPANPGRVGERLLENEPPMELEAG
jgi:AraC-like DNA-binding protein